ncbi:thioether cross-link-forming SCIFF peptide maturase, partial [bacterium]|nr:thioether cross-link-forming SCIFF peptide maturase [bacterium]
MIHQYILNGYHIVLDVNSGSIHTVDPLAYDVIGLFQVTSKEEIIEAMLGKYADDPTVTWEEILEVLEDVQGLQDAGLLFSEPVLGQPKDVPAQKTSQSTRAVDEVQSPQVVKALCLHVAHTCNLNCEYCFASQGKFHGDRALMSFEVGKQAIDFLIANSGSRHNLEVDFFGGEPLMNWDVVKRIVAYAREEEKKHNKNFRFTLTTNGMLIDDEVMDFCNREIHNVVLSLDGRKEVHDKLRRTFGDQGSYDTIVPKFQTFVGSREGKGYYIRGTFTHNNVDFTEDLFHMADLGFRELSMEPVVCPPGESYALTQEDLPELYRQYELLAKEMLKREKEGNPFTFYHYTLDLTEGPCIYKRI